jgi:hypothetical protein
MAALGKTPLVDVFAALVLAERRRAGTIAILDRSSS